MGSSNTIEQQSKLNADFQKYVDEQTTAMQATLNGCKTELTALVKKTFGDANITDSLLLIGGQYQHLQTLSEWSLEHVTDMIGTIKNTIFGGPTPKGSKAADSNQLKAAATSLAGMEAMIADAALSAIEGLLTGLTSGTNTDIMKNTIYKQISDGLYLFLTVVEYKYAKKDFLNNNTIDQTIYVYEAYSSAQGLAKLQSLGITKVTCDGYAKIVASDLATIDKITQALTALPVDDDKFEQKYDYYHGILNKTTADMEKNREQLDKLTHGVTNNARVALAQARRSLAA